MLPILALNLRINGISVNRKYSRLIDKVNNSNNYHTEKIVKYIKSALKSTELIREVIIILQLGIQAKEVKQKTPYFTI